MWGCVSRDLTIVPYWRSLYLCVGFFSVAAELCILSSCWGWGRLLLSLFLVCAQQSSWGTCGFLLCARQLASLLGFHTSLPPPAVGVSRGVWGFLATDILLPHFGFPLTLLPLRGSAPLPGASACLIPVCWSTPGVVLEGCVLCHLVFLPCAVLFLRACSVRCFP